MTDTDRLNGKKELGVDGMQLWVCEVAGPNGAACARDLGARGFGQVTIGEFDCEQLGLLRL